MAEQAKIGSFQLPVAAVDTYLKSRLSGLDGPPSVTAFRGGASNLTFLVQYPTRDLILRCPPPGVKAKSAHDMGREARILQGLREHFPLVPRVFDFCDDPAVLGMPFFVMERLDGVILRKDLTDGLSLSATRARALCERMLDTWVQLHTIDVETAGLTWLSKGDGYVGRQIRGWTRRYRNARTPDAGDFEPVIAWLAEKQPADAGACVIHNDFRFDNLVLKHGDLTQIIGVLDWELASVGDPLMDLGASLAYWVQADDAAVFHSFRRQPTHLAGMFTRAELVENYLKKTGLQAGDMTFYEVYGLFRLAGIAQQIYFRHYHGQMKDDRFAPFIHAVNYLEKRCLRLIEASTL